MQDRPKRKTAGLIVLGCAVIAGGLFLYLDYRRFKAETRGYLGVTLRPFEPGVSGNPAGRPKGSRNKLSEAFLQLSKSTWLPIPK
jgi:hypothetical protein